MPEISTGSPMEWAEAVLFLVKGLHVVEYGGLFLLATVVLRFGFAPVLAAWRSGVRRQ